MQAVRKAIATHPVPDVEPIVSLSEGSAKVRHPSRPDLELQTQGEVQETEEQITSTWYLFCVTVFAVSASGAVAHRRAHAFSLYVIQLKQLPDMPGRSDTACSKDLAELTSLSEDKSREYAELLKQHEFSLARYARLMDAFAILSELGP